MFLVYRGVQFFKQDADTHPKGRQEGAHSLIADICPSTSYKKHFKRWLR